MKERKVIIHFILLVLVSTSLFSQEPIIEWERTYGGDNDDCSGKIVQCEEGGFLITAISESTDGDFDESHGELDSWLIKISEAGNIEWKRNYGGPGRDSAPNIYPLDDGSFLLLGTTDSDDGDVFINRGWTDGWVMRVNATGEIIWSKTYGGSSPDLLGNFVQVPNGDFLIYGSTFSDDDDIIMNKGGYDAWMIRVDSNGNLLWSKTYGGSGDEGGGVIRQMNDGRFQLSTSTTSQDGDVLGKTESDADAWLVTVDENGELDILSSRTYGGSKDESLAFIGEDEKGNSIYIGFSDSEDGDVQNHFGSTDFWLIKLNQQYNIKTSKKYGGSNKELSSSSSFLMPNGHVIIAGTSFSNDGQVSDNYGDISLTDIWLLEIDENGDIVWEKNYGGSQPDTSPTLLKTENGFFLLATSESSDYDVSENRGGKDIWLAKFLFPPAEDERSCDFKLSPNPVRSGNIQVGFEVPMVGDFKVAIYDMAGRLAYFDEVENEIVKEATVEVPSNLASSLYLFQVEGNGNRCMEKLMLTR